MTAFPLPQHFTLYTGRVQRIVDAGGSVPDTYTHALERLNAYLNTATSNAADRLARAVINGESTQELHTAALAELAAQSEHKATLRNAVVDAVYDTLRNAYAAAAEANTKTLAATFNAAAAVFTASLTITDPDAPVETVMQASPKIRQAWLDIPAQAAALTRHAAALGEAAALQNPAITGNGYTIALTTRPGNTHRRKVWEAWNTTDGRAGRWAALHRLGVQIEAHDDIKNIQPYRAPRPIETRQERVKEGGIVGIRTVEVDPEDHDYQPAGGPAPRFASNPLGGW